MLIAAMSGRALAAAARRAEYAPLVADLFGDADMRAAAVGSARLAGDLETGFDPGDLEHRLAGLAEGRACEGLVCGTGFEDRPELLARLARRWPLLGNGAEAVAAVKDPLGLARLCARLGIAHPETRLEPPPAGEHGWLAKRIGGAGGAHVRDAEAASAAGGCVYYQRRVGGRPVSALFLANGDGAAVIGFSEQWSAPAPGMALRYGGAARPAEIAAPVEHAMHDAVGKIARAAGLRGLNSADFLVGDERIWLIEINPRPGATLDLFDSDATPLFAWHVAACRGEAPPDMPALPGAAACAIVYAERSIGAFPELDWPDWAADRQAAGSRVEAGWPICTVRAEASTHDRAIALVEERRAALLALARGEGP